MGLKGAKWRLTRSESLRKKSRIAWTLEIRTDDAQCEIEEGFHLSVSQVPGGFCRLVCAGLKKLEDPFGL
jgi:hypothetical protein